MRTEHVLKVAESQQANRDARREGTDLVVPSRQSEERLTTLPIARGSASLCQQCTGRFKTWHHSPQAQERVLASEVEEEQGEEQQILAPREQRGRKAAAEGGEEGEVLRRRAPLR
jgi:transcriptional regulator NrdR family protein